MDIPFGLMLILYVPGAIFLLKQITTSAFDAAFFIAGSPSCR